MKFREGTWDDGLKVLKHLREQQALTLDKLEMSPEALLRKALEQPATTILVNDKPAAMFGTVSTTLIGLTKIWLIATPLIEREPIAFLRASRRVLKEYHAKHGMLIGVVDRDFIKSKHWLEWCGFEELERGPEFITMRYSGGH